MADQVLIDSYCKNSYLADQVADLSLQNANLQFLLIDSYSENSYLADQVAELPPEMAICN